MVDAANKIHALDDHVINQIAAGEVVERPLSVVKELSENALDAGASRIEIQIENGGLTQISVTDDGAGIGVDDLPNAVTRHCTSKLTDAAELFALDTLGFRGEALASIAAVSRFSLISRERGAQHAWQLDCEFGAIKPIRPAAAYPLGTRVEVRNLFENTPARRKFQKQPRTEYLAILNFLKQLAFCHGDIEFVFIADDNPVFRVLAATDVNIKHRRGQSLFGKDFLHQSTEINREERSLRVTGWVGNESYHRPRTDLQYLTLNQRVIRDKSVLHAVRLAYDGKIPEGRYAAFALDIRLPSNEVDVNVHPSKSEVKFSEPRRIHDQLFSFIRQALSPVESAAQQSVPAATSSHMTNYPQVNSASVRRSQIAEKKQRAGYRAVPAFSLQLGESEHGNFAGMLGDDFALITVAGEALIIELNAFLSTLLGTRLSADIRSRPLIMPQAVPAEMNKHYQAERDALQRCGVVIEMLGPDRLVLREVPIVLPPLKYDRFINQMVVYSEIALADRIAMAAARSLAVPQDFKAQQRWFAQFVEQAATIKLDWREFGVQKTPAQWQEFLTS